MTMFTIDSTSEGFLEEADRAIQKAHKRGIDLTKIHPKGSRAYNLQEELELKSHALPSLIFFEVFEGDSLESLSQGDRESINHILDAIRAGSNTPRMHYSKEHKTQSLIDMCHALSEKGYNLPAEYKTYLNAPRTNLCITD